MKIAVEVNSLVMFRNLSLATAVIVAFVGSAFTSYAQLQAARHIRGATRAPEWLVAGSEARTGFREVIRQLVIWVRVADLSATCVVATKLWLLKRNSDQRNLGNHQQYDINRRMPSHLLAKVHLYEIGADGRVVSILEGVDFLRVRGWPKSVFMEAEYWGRHVVPGSLQPKALYRNAMIDGTVNHECQFSRPDGSLRWLRSEIRRISTNASRGQ